jgi:hypothetical protein
MVRAIASLPPPAAVGTTMVTVLVGKGQRGDGRQAVMATAAASMGAIKCFTGLSPWNGIGRFENT